VFKGRDSMGVRGIRLEEGDKVISMAVIRHLEISPEERATYFRMRRAVAGEAEAADPSAAVDEGEESENGSVEISTERYAALSASEQFILTVSQNGYGKRTSSFEYRITGRGGKGIVAMAVNKRNGPLVSSWPVEQNDQIMLVTDGGQLIRCPVSRDRVRHGGRRARRVRRAYQRGRGRRGGERGGVTPRPPALKRFR
jgi:DNA gyrase subunit A